MKLAPLRVPATRRPCETGKNGVPIACGAAALTNVFLAKKLMAELNWSTPWFPF